MRTLAMMCVLASPLVGQSVSCQSVYVIDNHADIPLIVSVVDKSPADSPLTVQGTVTFDPIDPSNAGCVLTIHNNGDHAVVAYGMVFDVVKPSGEPRTILTGGDRFISREYYLNGQTPPADYVKAGGDFVPLVPCHKFLAGHSRGPYLSRPASATIKLTGVQFDDGSTWGEVRELMFQRAEALAYLNKLKAAYVSGGPGGLEQELQKPIAEPDRKFRIGAQSLRLILLNQLQDDQARVALIDARLAQAASHAAWLK